MNRQATFTEKKAPEATVFGMRELLRLFCRGWALLLVLTLLGAALGAVAAKALSAAPTYTANTQMIYRWNLDSATGSKNEANQDFEALYNTCRHIAEYLSNQPGYDRWQAELPDGMDGISMAAGNSGYLPMVTIVVQAASPEDARTGLALAVEHAKRYVAQELDAMVLPETEDYHVEEATLLHAKSAVRFGALGALGGLVAAALILLARAVLRDTLDSPEEAIEALGLPVRAVLAAKPGKAAGDGVPLAQSDAFYAAALESALAENSVVLLAGGAETDVVAAAERLAAAFLERGKAARVCTLSGATAPGLCELAAGTCTLAEAAKQHGGVAVLGRGEPVDFAATAQGEQVAAALKCCRDAGGVTLLADGAAHYTALTALCAQQADAVYLAVSEGHTTLTDASRRRDALAAAGAALQGTVLCAPVRGRS